MKIFYVILSLLISLSALACDPMGKTGFAPENNLYIPAGIKSINGIEQSDFNAVIDEVIAVYKPIIEANGDKLVMNRLWDNGTVNATAQRQGSNVIVNMYGGLARHELISRDGFAVVLCHEIGHHLAGAPKIRRFFFNTWASNEGQSDYFATFQCFKRVYENDDNVEFISKIKVDETVTEKCSEVYKSESEIALCSRAAMAAKSTASLLASLRSKPAPKFDTPSDAVVRKTDNSHPAAQCRLDTYLQGAICDRAIDGQLSDRDANQATCNRSRGDKNGIRPLCWYKPSR